MNLPIKPRIVRCPRCGGPSEYGPGNASRPFCSERCKNHDFGAWASESYRVGDTGAPASAEADGDHPPHH
jgi:endogenous inhibitor of DNA gyrase (YacG/DUF329 family)